MKKTIRAGFVFIVGLLCLAPATTSAQSKENTKKTEARSSTSKDLFEGEEVLEITLSGQLKKLLGDRSQKPIYHQLTFSYKDEQSNVINLPAQAKTRGHFRRLKENCYYPPLALKFVKCDLLKASPFKKQNKLKLVMPCAGEEYVVREWLIYKLYNLVSEKSFKTRLVRIQLNDSSNKKQANPFYAFLIEDEDELAKRNGLVVINKKLQPEQAEPECFLTMAVFQYLIGNTDWSVQYQQNIKLLAPDPKGLVTSVVPYDFDHAGLVDAPYARPEEMLNMASIRQRRFRGYCLKDMKRFDSTVALFNRVKKDIYQTYSGCSFLSEKFVKNTLRYLDEFYEVINKPGDMKKEFWYPCNPDGTGNVVIKGLKEEKL